MSTQRREDLRKEMKRVLASLDRRWMEAASNEICDHLVNFLSHELSREIRHILAWIPFFPGEVDLTRFIGEQLGQREVYLPRVLPDRQMTFISIGEDWSERTETGHLGVPGPADSMGKRFEIENASSTLVLVPGLVFDRSGNRLGRGMGYYDRFLGLEGMQEAVRIGVGWSLQMVQDLPRHTHDISMQWWCDEEGAIICTNT